jgi:very-short-patch-repair endonuclease
MAKENSKAKMVATLHRIGHKPSIRGGNGTGPTQPEKILLEALPGAQYNHAVSLGSRQPGYPTCYKIDVALPFLKLGIECDGYSHQLLIRQVQDRKKEAKLRELGWTVLRLSNKRILNVTESVISELKSIISKLQDTQAMSSKMAQ